MPFDSQRVAAKSLHIYQQLTSDDNNNKKNYDTGDNNSRISDNGVDSWVVNYASLGSLALQLAQMFTQVDHGSKELPQDP